ncbi:hypothetical protein IR083_01465 [Dysgonomonas sp. GY75]|uniref:hypothetical protein n=1 Tax=Dysgonomonas sp. GY75 TaxID=2780419 RepID=UPI00188473EB|nr:hypothetical protein [Dysgonomonas sp. GY75]MBF0647484.1 hypothetical protein [Dysgonomonas sp. GY75]
MRSKIVRYIILISLLLLTAWGTAAHFYRKSEDEKIQDFDADKFCKIGFTDEELDLFCDIAFNRAGERIRKWNTDIRVEIEDTGKLDKNVIAEVDSVITLLRPLIVPLRIERVPDNGNVIVYKNVKSAPANKPRQKPIFVNGIARINEAIDHAWEINFAHIYDGRESGTQTLMHEFEHMLGLEHPMMLYEYYLTIGRSAIPQHYSAYGGWLRFQGVPYYISEQEKTVIRMLYSPEIKAGLKKDDFLKRMENNIKITTR